MPSETRHTSEHLVHTDRQFRVPSSDMSVNVRGRIVLFVAVGARVSRRLAALVPNQVPHPSEARVALGTDITGHGRHPAPLRQLYI